MSRRGKKDLRASPDLTEDEFVVVPPHGGAAAAADAKAQRSDRVKGSPEEEAQYEEQADMAYRAELLGVEVPPVAPPGHVLVQEEEPTDTKQVTFWYALSRMAQNKTALQQLYFTTLLMVCVPLGMMALAYYLVLVPFFPDPDSRLTWSAVAGVIGVNIVALGFGYFAYHDSEDDGEPGDAVPASGQSAEAIEAKRAKWAAWEQEQEAKESREDQERLRDLRERRDGKKDDAASQDAEEEQDDSATAADSSKSNTRSRSSRSNKKDSALGDDAEDSVAAAPKSKRSAKKGSNKAE